MHEREAEADWEVDSEAENRDREGVGVRVDVALVDGVTVGETVADGGQSAFMSDTTCACVRTAAYSRTLSKSPVK